MLTNLAYLGLFYITVNILGFTIEKIKIPKIYAALFLGVFLSTNSFVLNIVKEPFIYTLAQIGMFSLLFFLGFNIDIDKILGQRHLILKVTFWMILCEVIVGTLLLHTFFDVVWPLAAFISLSFATVGEIAILPLLKEAGLLNTHFGQMVLGVGILDDVVEILSFIILMFFISHSGVVALWLELLPLVAILIGFLARRLKILNMDRFERFVGFFSLLVFGPLFFFYAGTEAQLNILLSNIGLIVFFTLIIKITKLISVYMASRKVLGPKKAIVMGVSLSVKFSTSIIIITVLLQKGLISVDLFSVLIGIKVLFKFIVPVLLSYLLKRWQLAFVEN